ncbi:MAG: anti-sigma F factor [Bacillus thermozeamaize]|uniref:Anti-sigma F factor n=1 Tax=Bacillus thermozeamaize TaxID=230954 RepID=A0A1Y3PBY7_9BACI|nr:MAG: anti-sigma F factor [Bacillus thermozeamaize]
MSISFAAVPENVSFARVVVAAFVSQVDPTMQELTDLQTVVSEAVTNAIVHGYDNNPDGVVTITAKLIEQAVELTVEDRGVGIENLEKAREPLYTTKPDKEHTGMGFTIMENFVNDIQIETALGKGTKIRFVKYLQANEAMYN